MDAGRDLGSGDESLGFGVSSSHIHSCGQTPLGTGLPQPKSHPAPQLTQHCPSVLLLQLLSPCALPVPSPLLSQSLGFLKAGASHSACFPLDSDSLVGIPDTQYMLIEGSKHREIQPCVCLPGGSRDMGVIMWSPSLASGRPRRQFLELLRLRGAQDFSSAASTWNQMNLQVLI